MNVQEEINEYIASQPEPKRSEMQEMHRVIQQAMPACKLWFLDGKNSEGKVVSNPNFGYGFYIMKYTDGTTREFYQIGLSANKTGISVYILGTRRQETPGRNIRQQPRGRDRVLHPVQNSKKYKHRRPRSGDCVWA